MSLTPLKNKNEIVIIKISVSKKNAIRDSKFVKLPNSNVDIGRFRLSNMLSFEKSTKKSSQSEKLEYRCIVDLFHLRTRV